MAFFLDRYMTPVSKEYHGYMIKPEYRHLLPKALGRPKEYLMLPFCLPEHNEMLKKTRLVLEQKMQTLASDKRQYPGSYNQFLL